MFALLISALLAQPAPVASTEPSALPIATAPGGSPIFGRMPQRMLPPIVSGDAVIRNSGSTNTSGYTVVVHADFSVDVYDRGTTRHDTSVEPQTKWLFAKLKADEPFASLGVAGCMKSASFGTTTTVAYDGSTTPDLTCSGSPNTRELARTVEAIVARLDIKPAIGHFRRLMM
jgi:hypothetical protein